MSLHTCVNVHDLHWVYNSNYTCVCIAIHYIYYTELREITRSCDIHNYSILQPMSVFSSPTIPGTGVVKVGHGEIVYQFIVSVKYIDL